MVNSPDAEQRVGIQLLARPRILELTEEEDKVIPQQLLDEALAIRLHESFGNLLDVEFPSPKNGRNYVLRSKGCAGMLPVDGTIIRISPKVRVSNLFRMLEYAYDLKSFQILEGRVEVESIDEIYDRLATILAKRALDRLRRGLFRAYIEEEEREGSTFLRGRFLPAQTLLLRKRGSARVACRYEELTSDIIDNTIVAWTLHRLSRSVLQREDVIPLVEKAARGFSDVVHLVPVLPTDCVGRVYHRLNDDYKPIHMLCKFFLEHQGPGVYEGLHEFMPFIVDMPDLFQLFVAKWLEGRLPGIATKPLHRVRLDESGKLFFSIDIVLRDSATDKVLAVLDTKYKRPIEPAAADIEQVVAYATAMRTDKAILVYPSAVTKLIRARAGGVDVEPVVFDIGGDLDESGEHFSRQLLVKLAA